MANFNLNALSNALRNASGAVTNFVSTVRQAVNAQTNMNNSTNQVINSMRNMANTLSSAVSKIVNVLKTLAKIATTVFSGVVKVFGTLGKGVKSIISLFGNLGNRVKGTSSSMSLFSRSATELRSKILLLKGAFDSLFNNSAVNKAQKLLSSISTLNTIIGTEATDETIKWAESMEYAFGLSARDLISDLREVNAVMNGLGMQKKDISEASKNLLIMSNYLAGLGMAGGNSSNVMEKFMSGLRGETEAIEDLGVDLKVKNQDRYLAQLRAMGGEYANIGTSFSELNKEAQVYVTYSNIMSQIMASYPNMAKNFAKSFDTVTGRISLFKSSVSSLTTVLGTGLVNVFAKLTTVLIPLINWVTNLISKFFAFFGISTEVTKSMNNVGGMADNIDLGGMNTGLDETKENLDEVTKSANKAKGSLQGFDRINNVSTSSGGGSASDVSGGAGAFDYSKLMTSMLDELNAEMEKATQSYADTLHDKMMENLRTYWDKFNEYAKEVTGRANFDLGFNWGAIRDNLRTVLSNVGSFIKSWGSFFIEIGLKIADDMNIGLIVTKITELISKITELANAFSKVAIPVLREFYDKNLKPIFEDLGVVISENLDKAIKSIQGWIDYFKNTNKATADMTKSVNNLWKVFNGEKEASGVLEHLVGIFGALGEVVKALWPVVKELIASFAEFAKNELLPWILEKLRELAEWLRENKDRIVDLLEKVGSIAWAGFKVFVEVLAWLIDLLVKHQGLIIGFFAGLVTIKVASWGLKTASAIGHMAEGLKGFINLFRSGGAFAGVGTAISGFFRNLGTSITSAVGTIRSGLSTAGNAISGFVSAHSGVLATGAMAVAGVGMGAYDAKKTYDKREEIFGKEEGNTTSAKVSSVVGGFIGGSGGGLADETASAGKKAKNVGMNALKGAALGGAIGSVIPGVGTAIGAAVGGVVGTVTGAIGGTNIAKAINGAWEGIKKVASSAWESIKSGASKAGEAISDTWDNIKEGASEKWESITTTVSGAWENIKIGASITWENMNVGFSNVTAWIGERFANLGNTISNIWYNVSSVISNVFSGISTIATEIFAGIGNTLSNIGTSVGNIFTGIGTVASDVFNGIGSVILGIGDTVSNVFNGIYNTVTGILSDLLDFAGNIIDGVGDAVGGLVDGIKDIGGGAWDAVSSTVSNGWNGLKSGASALVGRNITSHANGGSIGGGQLFRANENGQAELIGNIDSTSKTNVANNNMIIEAMTAGVFEGVYNALAEVDSQRGNTGVGTGGLAKVEINGFGVIDGAMLSELARMLGPYLNSNNSNIADVNFSI